MASASLLYVRRICCDLNSSWSISRFHPTWSRLDRTDEEAEALVIVHFPPQALAEEVGLEPPPTRPSGRPCPARRLVFRLPGNGGLPLTTEALLRLDHMDTGSGPGRSATRHRPAPDIGPPAPARPLETAIEFPWRPTLSPDHLGRWHAATTAAGSTGTHELWSAVPPSRQQSATGHRRPDRYVPEDHARRPGPCQVHRSW